MEGELKRLFLEMSDHRGELNKLKDSLPRSESESVRALEEKFDAFSARVVAFMDRMENRMDELESYSRRNCLLIHGIPETPGESCNDVVINLLRVKKVAMLENRDIDRAHRLGPAKENRDKPRPMIVKFVGYGPRSSVFQNKSKMKGSGKTITESLTKQRHEVLAAARAAHGISNAWSLDGRIVVLSGGQKHKVTTLEALKLVPVQEATQTTARANDKPLPSPNKVVTRNRNKKKDENLTQRTQHNKPNVNTESKKEEEKRDEEGQDDTDAASDSDRS